MYVEVNPKDKRITIWLSQSDRTTDSVQQGLTRLYGQWSNQGYLPIVFYGGRGDWQEQTAQLLLHNRNQLAQQEVADTRA